MKELELDKLLSIFLLINIFIAVASTYVLTNDDLYFQFYSEQLAYERILELIAEQKKWQWIGYVILPVFYTIKFFLISCVLLTGTFIVGLKAKFKEVFKIAVFAEFIFFVPMLMKLVWFGFIDRDYTLHDLMGYAPLSLDNVFDVTETSPWISPLLKTISVFEAVYWILLGYGLYQVLERPFEETMGLVVASYGSAWVVWQVFIIFLMINFQT